jgi:hypothetical protein
MRERYESGMDREAEERIIALACKNWKCTSEKMPISYVLDYALIREGGAVALAECKKRNNLMGQYPTIFIATKKLIAAQEFLCFGLRTYFIVEWSDYTGYIDISEQPDEIQWGGRGNMRDSADRELMAHYKIERVFKLSQ